MTHNNSPLPNQVYLDFAIRFSWHKMSRMYNLVAAEHGITINIGAILLNVDKEGTPSTQLGPKMGMEPTSLSRTLKTMEDDGLIERKIDYSDKRKVLIFLTQAGVQKRKLIKTVINNFNQKLQSIIDPEKLATCIEVLHTINNQVESELVEKNRTHYE